MNTRTAYTDGPFGETNNKQQWSERLLRSELMRWLVCKYERARRTHVRKMLLSIELVYVICF